MANAHIVSDHESRIPAQFVREGALNYAETPMLWTRKRDYAMAIAQDGLGAGTELGVAPHEPGDKCYRAIVKAAKAAWLAADPRALFAEFPQFVRYHAPALADALTAEAATVAAVVTPAPAPKAKPAPVKRSLAVESVAALAPMAPSTAPAPDTRLDAIEATLAGITSTIGTLAQLVASLLPAPAPAPAAAPSVAALASMAPKAKAPAASVKRTRLPEQGPRERAVAANALVASKGTTRASTLAPGNRNN